MTMSVPVALPVIGKVPLPELGNVVGSSAPQRP
jgi:hypothetical protein